MGATVVIGRYRNRVHERHRFLATGCGRHDRLPVRVLLFVPLGQGFVVATLTGVQDARRCRRMRRCGLGIGTVVGLVLALGLYRNHERAIGVANNVHDCSSSGRRPMGSTHPDRM